MFSFPSEYEQFLLSQCKLKTDELPKPCPVASQDVTSKQEQVTLCSTCLWPQRSTAQWEAEGELSLPFDVWSASVSSCLHPKGKLRHEVNKQHVYWGRVARALNWKAPLPLLDSLSYCSTSSTAFVGCPSSEHWRWDLKHLVQISPKSMQLWPRQASQCELRKYLTKT